ncbi:hypothetical protein [Amycolatopsis sp. cg9]|uniref:hypothetical protein n=1 Tax=Amycolatopsis sp. cg9 TaxID=3238801 RepID=UPI0035258A21
MPDLPYGIAAVFAGVALPASLLAGKAGNRLPARTVRRTFASLILVVAAAVAAAARFAPAALHGG